MVNATAKAEWSALSNTGTIDTRKIVPHAGAQTGELARRAKDAAETKTTSSLLHNSPTAPSRE